VIRKSLLALVLLPSLACAQSVDLAGVPQSCSAPLAHDMEASNIPAILDLGAAAAKIVSIQTMNNQRAYEYYPGLRKIDCYLIVRWSNGQVDRFYSAWNNKYGQTMVSYGH
jgi:hypothetical protein